MCGGGKVQDNSDKVAQIQADAAEKARLAEEAKQKQKEAQFNTNLNNAYATAIDDAKRYFSDQGLDPEAYLPDITSSVNAKKALVPFLDSTPGTYFAGAGAQAYNDKQTGMQNKFLRELDSFAGNGFDKSMVGDTADDASLAAILEDAFGTANTQLDLQRKRGVLTDAGMGEALKELTRQKAGAKSNLDIVGQAILEKGRSKLRGTAADARTAASTARLGSNFNPFDTQRTLSNSAADFFASLGDTLKGAAPTDLFDVSKAFMKGGVAQGAGNYGYDPEASSGLFALFDDQNKKKQQQTVSPF